MSDIYLSITETPTVVTLSAPVVSGALASTVTVANTVTVALDSNSLSALENVTVTVGAAITGTVTVSNFPATQPISIASVTIGNTVTIAGTVTANPTGTQTIAGTVTANVPDLALVVGENQNTPNPAHGIQIGYISEISGTFVNVSDSTDSYQQLPIKGTVTIGSALPAGTNRIGVVTIGAGTVTIGAGTAQIGSVTASISGTVPISISSVTVGNSVTIGSLPAISGTVTANLAISSTPITKGSFTSLASATLVPANTSRKMATVYNLGAGQLFVNAGATATTLGGGFMVALSSGDFYECDYTTTTLSAIFATAGTASWVSH